MLATAAAGTQPSLDAIQTNITTTTKMERRDSSTSESSLEHLDLGRTPKKLSSLSSATSTPHTAITNRINAANNKNEINPQDSTTSTDVTSAAVTSAAATSSTTPTTTTERTAADATNTTLPAHQTRLHDSDEANDYDDDEEESSPDEQQHVKQNTLNSRAQRHHKRRSTQPRLDKRTSVHLELSGDDPTSLRKKFRFNRSTSASEQLTNNESGFVDASSSSSHYLNASALSLIGAAVTAMATAPTTTATTTTPMLTMSETTMGVGISMTPPHSLMPATVSRSASLSAAGSHSSSSAASSPRGCGGAGLTASSVSVSSPESGIGDRDREDMKFVCTICEVVSATRHEFTNHIRCHNYASGDTENYTCAICSKVLSSASSLDRHVLVHTGERPFNCKYCHLTFTTNGNMHRHMRTHKQHQHNHHRRNSNGTKHNSNSQSNNNNNNTLANQTLSNSSNTPANFIHATNTNNTTSGTYKQLSHELIGEGVKSSSAAAAAASSEAMEAIKMTDATAGGALMGSATTGGAINTGVNGKRLHSSGVESCESDGGCSTDSSSSATSHSSNKHNHHNNNNNSNNNKNINSDNINNNIFNNYNNTNEKRHNLGTFKRKSSEQHGDEMDADDAHDADNMTTTTTMKRRMKTTINNNVIGEDVDAEDARCRNSPNAPYDYDETDEQKPTFACPVCPVCNAGDFADMRALDNHLDSEHADIPAKCRHCEVVFRTHRQLSTHPCTQRLHSKRHMPLVECVKCELSFADGSALELHARECHSNEVRQPIRRSRSLSESYATTAPNAARPPMDDEVEEKHARDARQQFFRQLYMQSQKPYSAQNELSAKDEEERAESIHNVSASDIKLEADIEQTTDQMAHNLQAHDSKDLADIQSILNMTSSSSTSNFLKNFEQSVNTPSSNYSFDKDEEEAQDAFTSEFRKMKLRGEFPCKLCTAVFPNLRALKGHNRVHLSAVGPAGPFRCNMCPYTICDKAALVRHMRTHNGDRPYECAECNYAFTTKANCERHLRNRHAKTTRDEVKRAIIYHPSEDSTCDDPAKKLHMFSSPDFEDDIDLQYQQHQPKDRSTPVSHLKEMLTTDSPSTKPMKIQVKSLEQLIDKSSGSIGSASYSEVYEERAVAPVVAPQRSAPTAADVAPIDLSMDVLDLSKKATVKHAVEQEFAAAPAPAALPPIIDNALDAEKKLDIFSYVKENLNMPKMLELWSLSAQFPFMPDFRPLMNQMFANSAAAAAAAAGNPFAPPSVDMSKAAPPSMPAPPNMTPSMLPHLSALMSDKLNTPTDPNVMSQMLPKTLMTPPSPNTAMNMPRHSPHMQTQTMLPGGPVKMVIKNGVLMPKQKQRRYRTERPFACEHCSARFTLRSNMERHVKQQHPQYYAQRHRSGHHSMRGRGASGAIAINSISHLQAAFAQAHNQVNNHQAQGNGLSASPISEQVKYAILAQQLKARKDTDLLQQALAHGSSSIANNHHLLLNAGGALGTLGPPPNGLQYPFSPMSQQAGNMNGGAMEDDEPKLIIDEDDEEDDVEEILDDEENEEEDQEEEELQLGSEGTENNMHAAQTAAAPMREELKKAPPSTSGESVNETAKKVAETILEQAIKTGQRLNQAHAKPSAAAFPAKPLLAKSMPIKSVAPPTPVAPAAPATPANTMKAMIAQAESVGKFLKEVASSPFKDESQDLVPVAKLVDNATSNSVSFNNYFRPSDVANHMEQSDEEGLVASGSASESNNSGTEDVAAPVEPKKKSAYSLAPNRVSCPYCQRMFPWSSSLRRHILTHTGQKPFKCSHCPLLFTTKSNCDRHLLRKHGDVESAVSVYVPTEDVNEPIPVPKSVEEIEQQQRQREEEERKRKAEEAQLARERREKAERQQLEQEQQSKLFKHLQQLSATMNSTVTANAAANTVAAADASDTRAKDSLAQQLNADLPYKCHLCESSFAERFNCLEHIKVQHIAEFTLLLAKGAIVSDAEANQTQLLEEEERRLGEESNNYAALLPKLPAYTNRKVICAFCVRRFWSTEDLRRHMRTHSGERPFQCEICLRKFTLKHSMLRHMKKHTTNRCQNGAAGGDASTTGNSGSDFSDDEQMPTPTATSTASNVSAAPPTSSTQTATAAAAHATLSVLRTPRIQELLSKANEWRSSHLVGEHKENIAEEQPNGLHSDLIGNLLGISDQGILNKLLSSADEAAKLLGVEK